MASMYFSPLKIGLVFLKLLSLLTGLTARIEHLTHIHTPCGIRNWCPVIDDEFFSLPFVVVLKWISPINLATGLHNALQNYPH